VTASGEHATWGNPNFKFIQQDVTEFIFLEGPVSTSGICLAGEPIDYLELPIQTLKVGSLGTPRPWDWQKVKTSPFSPPRPRRFTRPAGSSQTEDYWGNVNPIGLAAATTKETLRRSANDGLSAAARCPNPHRAHL